MVNLPGLRAGKRGCLALLLLAIARATGCRVRIPNGRLAVWVPGTPFNLWISPKPAYTWSCSAGGAIQVYPDGTVQEYFPAADSIRW